MNREIDHILDSYGELLSSVDRWFARAAWASGGGVVCARGCSACCRGLFDITLLDAFLLKRGIDLLPFQVREGVNGRARKRLDDLLSVRPDLEYPYILNILPEEEWNELMPEEDETRCPLLGLDGLCLTYEFRPMTCRLHGIPIIDLTGEVFDDEWCTMNFAGSNPMSINGIRWEFRKLFQFEMALFHRFTNALLNQKVNELDTFIATAVLTDFMGFDWKGWWSGNSGRIRRGGCGGR